MHSLQLLDASMSTEQSSSPARCPDPPLFTPACREESDARIMKGAQELKLRSFNTGVGV